ERPPGEHGLRVRGVPDRDGAPDALRARPLRGVVDGERDEGIQLDGKLPARGELRAERLGVARDQVAAKGRRAVEGEDVRALRRGCGVRGVRRAAWGGGGGEIERELGEHTARQRDRREDGIAAYAGDGGCSTWHESTDARRLPQKILRAMGDGPSRMM